MRCKGIIGLNLVVVLTLGLVMGVLNLIFWSSPVPTGEGSEVSELLTTFIIGGVGWLVMPPLLFVVSSFVGVVAATVVVVDVIVEGTFDVIVVVVAVLDCEE